MALVAIPVRKDVPDYEFTIDLDKVVYSLRFTYNDRSGKWSMDVKTEDGTEIVVGIPLVGDWDLLGRFKDSRLPLGRMFTWDSTGKGQEPNADNFGDAVLLMYQEASA